MRNRLLLGITLLLAATGISAQSSAYWGINTYPNFTHRRLIAFSNISQTAIDSIEKREVARPSWSAGLAMGWRGPKVGFQVGVDYMDAGYRTQKELVPPEDPKFGDASMRRVDYQSAYIAVPIELHFYQRLNDRNEFYFMMGTGLSYYLSNTTTTIYFSGEDKITSSDANKDYRNVNTAVQFGLGWAHDLSPHIRLALQPNFQFWMRGMLKENDLNRNLYSFGLRVGLFWQTARE